MERLGSPGEIGRGPVGGGFKALAHDRGMIAEGREGSVRGGVEAFAQGLGLRGENAERLLADRADLLADFRRVAAQGVKRRREPLLQPLCITGERRDGLIGGGLQPAGDLLGAARQRLQRLAESGDKAFVERLGSPGEIGRGAVGGGFKAFAHDRGMFIEGREGSIRGGVEPFAQGFGLRRERAKRLLADRADLFADFRCVAAQGVKRR